MKKQPRPQEYRLDSVVGVEGTLRADTLVDDPSLGLSAPRPCPPGADSTLRTAGRGGGTVSETASTADRASGGDGLSPSTVPIGADGTFDTVGFSDSVSASSAPPAGIDGTSDTWFLSRTPAVHGSAGAANGVDGTSSTDTADGVSTHASTAASSATTEEGESRRSKRDGPLDACPLDARQTKRVRLGSLPNSSSATGQVPPPSSTEADLGDAAMAAGEGGGVSRDARCATLGGSHPSPVSIGADGALGTAGAPNRRNLIRQIAREAATSRSRKKARQASPGALASGPSPPPPVPTQAVPPRSTAVSRSRSPVSSSTVSGVVLPLPPSLAPRGPAAPRGPSIHVSPEWLRAHPELGWLRPNGPGAARSSGKASRPPS